MTEVNKVVTDLKEGFNSLLDRIRHPKTQTKKDSSIDDTKHNVNTSDEKIETTTIDAKQQDVINCPHKQHYDHKENMCVADTPSNCPNGTQWDLYQEKCLDNSTIFANQTQDVQNDKQVKIESHNNDEKLENKMVDLALKITVYKEFNDVNCCDPKFHYDFQEHICVPDSENSCPKNITTWNEEKGECIISFDNICASYNTI